jgi:hypothetical protein
MKMIDRAVLIEFDDKLDGHHRSIQVEIPDDWRFYWSAPDQCWCFKTWEDTSFRFNGKYSEGDRKYTLPLIAAYGAAVWRERHTMLYKKVADEGRIHYRYGAEDEPEYKELCDYDDKQACWQVLFYNLSK